MNNVKCLYLLATVVMTTLISACQPSTFSMGDATPAASLVPSPSISSTPDVEVSPPTPVQYLEFSSLRELQKAAKFPILLPTYIPDQLPFYKGWISDYANGDENVRLLYTEQGDALDANLKSVDIQMEMTDELISKDTLSRRFKTAALDVREVQVRGQVGFTYWTRSVAGGNSAHLVWREGTFNFSISLFGAWPQPDESSPHSLDDVLLEIAESLEKVQ